ncbi:Z1 domain-containing protein [Cohnella rhizosphaerae]|uniref:Z1 domain-containing protein n=1 Tax=Cohnella rhizosphaerae TaxID=1457232 RepID=A0A9X4KTQ8_9BACL|nr:Z1 domain-containing protein [Cohnella rhizosphaerae]MDG0810603.1 Z1 domain-containing protein [Cohnella rhizosphaerae]
MLSQAAQMLERFISVAVNTKYPDAPPSEDEFIAEANALRAAFPIPDEEFEQVVRNLKAALVITMDVGVYISNRSSDHQSWLPSRRAGIDFYYWNRFKRYLEDVKGWNTRVTANLETVSNDIVDLFGDPQSSKPWQRRGLVLGDVQSGKTVNYTAICNKAADTGYKVIIVLAGTMENLRMQTQKRLDKEFAGRLSKDLLRLKGKQEVKNVFDGVGKLDSTKRISAFTSVLYDFNSSILNSNDLTLKNIKEPALFVVKKNKSVLKNLESWLYSNNADNSGKIDLPLLLIDDEADNASVNTRKEEEDPTAINAAIRSILNRFYQATYLGITATPFANIFINPETEDDMVGDDLFPRDFIYVLSPPTNYIGSNAMFGEEAKYEKSIVQINTEEIECFFPFRHKKDLAVDDLPPSLYEAMGYFLLANAVRDVRGDIKDHRSMLINVSRFTDVQVKIRENIIVWLEQVKSDVRNYAAWEEEQALQIRSLNLLKQIWDKYGLKDKAGVSWRILQMEYLHKAISPLEVRAVNQKTGAASLNYDTHEENGLRVIAVGGNSLSRGLTLEGLCTSYFYRNSQMYDTLLQMARWFGYRPNYSDLFKVWMSADVIDWYGYITAAANELKDEISRMNKHDLTPRDFGLKVRQDPNSLIVTARNKMRTATHVSRPISVTGKLLETPRLKSKPDVLAANERAFKLFVASLDSAGSRRDIDQNGLMWSGIHKDLIVELLYSFETHPWHMSFQGKALAEYIEKNSGFIEWDVFIPFGSDTTEFELEGANGTISLKREKRYVEEANGMIKVMGTKVRVGSGGCTKAGLSSDQIKAAEISFRQLNRDRRNVPDSAYLIGDRKPLLMLHVLKSTQKENEPANPKIPETLYAIGLGLPGNGQTEAAYYVVNMVEVSNWMDIDDDEDDDNVV